MKKTLLKTFYHLGAFAPFHLTTGGKILILTYHRFSPEKNPQKTSRGEFASHLAYLKKRNVVLSLTAAAEHLRNEKPPPPGATVITIDDGYADAYEIAFPLLKRFGFPATLFCVTDFLDGKRWVWTDLMRYVLSETKENFIRIEFESGDRIETKLSNEQQRLEIASRVNSRLKKMPDEKKELKIGEIAEKLNVKIPASPTAEYLPIGWQQAREMDANHLRIESHTVTHPILTRINQARLDEELRNSKKRLEDVLDRPVENFCYPNGSLDENVCKAVENAGYKCAVTTRYGFNETTQNRFALNRIDAQSAIESFAQSVSGFEAVKQNYFNAKTQRRGGAKDF